MALTMTAELADTFRTKREGVVFVFDAIAGAFPKAPIHPLSLAGEFVPLEEARLRPLEFAADNWIAGALYVAEKYPDCILFDVGSTTTDIIPVRNGRIAAGGRTDMERLTSGELVYTGILRTNPNTIADKVPVDGRMCRTAAEYFAVMADVYLLLGFISEDEYTCPTADGRDRTPESCRERLARLVCADGEMLNAEQTLKLARYLHERQIRQLTDALFQVLSGLEDGFALPAAVAGAGVFSGFSGSAATGAHRPGPGKGMGSRICDRPSRAGRGGSPCRNDRWGGIMIEVVIKVGGSLSRGKELGALCLILAELGREHRLLVVPGGGPFADAVRDCDRTFHLGDHASHWMAVLAMDQFGILLSELIPNGEPVRDADSARRVALSGKVPVLLPYDLLHRADPLPHSWTVTSDSIAAWVAETFGSNRLILLKSMDGFFDGTGPPAPITLTQLARWDGVDPYLSTVLSSNALDLWIVNGNEPDRLKELLTKGMTRGTCLLR